MLEKLKKTWADLSKSEPGRRFQDRYEAHQSEDHGAWNARKVLKVLGGLALIIPGIIMIPAPGPGAIIVVIGLAMIADEFGPVARFLDRAELWLRKLYDKLWGTASTAQRACVAVAAGLIFAGLCYWGYQMFGGERLVAQAKQLIP